MDNGLSATFRQLDLEVLLADVVLRLQLGSREPGLEELGEELSGTCLRLARSRESSPARWWFWRSAVEVTLASASDEAPSRRRHRRAALRALRRSRELSEVYPPVPVTRWVDAVELSDLQKAILAAPTIAVLPIAPTVVGFLRTQVQELEDLRRMGLAIRSPQIVQLTRKRLAANGEACREIDPLEGPQLSGIPDLPPWELVAHVLQEEPGAELIESRLRRLVLEEVADLAGRGTAPARCADLLEVLAICDSWHIFAPGMPVGWGEVRQDPVLDSLLNRAFWLGSMQAGGELPWIETNNLAAGLSGGGAVLWMRELDKDFGEIIVAGFSHANGWFAHRFRPSERDREALHQMSSGVGYRVDPDTFRTLGEKVFKSGGVSSPDVFGFIDVAPSPRLRPLPVEALVVEGQVLAESNLVRNLPAHSCRAWLSPAPEMGRPLRVVGLFDQRLPGSSAEVEALRRLVREGHADGVGYSGPGLLEEALADQQWDLLTIAVHGQQVLGVPLLGGHGVAFGIPRVLTWRVPPCVCLASCRSARASHGALPLDWVTVMLRQGARSVIAARWAIPDSSSSRVVSEMYDRMASRGMSMDLAWWFAARSERMISPHPWYWAGLAFYGQ